MNVHLSKVIEKLIDAGVAHRYGNLIRGHFNADKHRHHLDESELKAWFDLVKPYLKPELECQSIDDVDGFDFMFELIKLDEEICGIS